MYRLLEFIQDKHLVYQNKERGDTLLCDYRLLIDGGGKTLSFVSVCKSDLKNFDLSELALLAYQEIERPNTEILYKSIIAWCTPPLNNTAKVDVREESERIMEEFESVGFKLDSFMKELIIEKVIQHFETPIRQPT